MKKNFGNMVFLTGIVVMLAGCLGHVTPGPFSIAGTILDWDGNPVGGVDLIYASGLVSSGEDGEYTIENILHPTTLRPVLSGYQFYPATQDITRQVTTYHFTAIPEMELEQPLTVRPGYPAAFAGGIIVDISQVQADPGAWIQLQEANVDSFLGDPVGPVVQISYEGLTLPGDVWLQLPLHEQAGSRPTVFHYNQENETWAPLDSEHLNGTVRARTSHFSIFGVFDSLLVETDPLGLVECGLFSAEIALILPAPDTFQAEYTGQQLQLTDSFSELTVTHIGYSEDYRQMLVSLTGNLFADEIGAFGRIYLPPDAWSGSSVLIADIELLQDTSTTLTLTPQQVTANREFFLEFSVALTKPENPFFNQQSLFTDLRPDHIQLGGDLANLHVMNAGSNGEGGIIALGGDLVRSSGRGQIEISGAAWSGFRPLQVEVEIEPGFAALQVEPDVLIESRFVHQEIVLTLDNPEARFLANAGQHIDFHGDLAQLTPLFPAVEDGGRQLRISLQGSCEFLGVPNAITVGAEGWDGDHPLSVHFFVLPDMITDLEVTPRRVQPRPGFQELFHLRLVGDGRDYPYTQPTFANLRPENIRLDADFSSLTVSNVYTQGYPAGEAVIELSGDLEDRMDLGVITLLDGSWSGWNELFAFAHVMPDHHMDISPSLMYESSQVDTMLTLTLNEPEQEFLPHLNASHIHLGGAFASLQVDWAFPSFDSANEAEIRLSGALPPSDAGVHGNTRWGTVAVDATAWTGQSGIRGVVQVKDTQTDVFIHVLPQPVTTGPVSTTLMLMLDVISDQRADPEWRPAFDQALAAQHISLTGALAGLEVIEAYVDFSLPRITYVSLSGYLPHAAGVGQINVDAAAWCGYHDLEGDVQVEVATQQYTLFATADTYVDNNWTNPSAGSDTSLFVVNYPGDPPSRNYTYIRFGGVSSLPQGTVRRAILRMYSNMAPDGNQGRVGVRPVLGPWGENTLAWNTQPDVSSWIVATSAIPSQPALIQWDVTSLVQQWVNGTRPNYGIRLAQESLGAWLFMSFNSREAAAMRPVLIVQY